jgi:tight adherence protein C
VSVVLAAFSTALLGATVVTAVAGSRPLLRRRLAPYLESARSRLGLPPVRDGSLRSPFRWIPGHRSDSDLGDRLRQAGLGGEDVGADVLRFRVRWAVVTVGWATAGVVLSAALALDPGPAIGLVVAATAAGFSRPPASLTKRVEDRAARMRSEVYTVDQVLAVWIRSGASVAGALERMVGRGRGPVVGELERALRLHRGGLPLADALRRVAEGTPEPACARTYRTLAAGTERGTDLGGTLLALAEDVRDARREATRRSAVRRRAAMLVPIVAVLAPVLLLFVAAPLPSIVFGTP